MMSIALKRLLVVVLVWVTLPMVGQAAPSGSPTPRVAQAKQEVMTALSVGNPGHAEEILDRTFRAQPDPTLLYPLGLVAQAQGRTVAALDLYRRYQDLERLSKPSEAGCTGKLYSVGDCAKAGAWRANFSPRNCGSGLNR